VKPEAFQHRKVGRLSIWARWLWLGMLTHADDDGRLIADPGHLRLLLFGYDEDVTPTKVEAWLDEVAATGLVVRYEGDGEPLVYFPDWHEHQRIDRPKPSTLPAPPPRKSTTEKRPHRKTGRIPSGRPPSEKRPERDNGPCSEDLPSTTDRRRIDDASATHRRVDRIGSDLDLDLETPPKPPAADAAASVEPPSVEAELFASNGHRPVTSKAKNPKRREDDPLGFAEVWAAYPEHEDRAQAVKRFRERPADVTVEMLLAGIARWKRSDRWARGFVPYLSRWLKEKRWEAEPRASSGLSPRTSGNIEAARGAAARIMGARP
jgi:hypothetical protein